MHWKSKSSYLVLITILLLSNWLSAQNPVLFKPRFQGDVQGNITFIANNILNRSEKKTPSNTPYNELNQKSEMNDMFTMKYIDIDTFENTVSSSAAYLSWPEAEERELLFAGLYYSGTYPYKEGIRTKEWKYVASKNGRESIDSVLVMLPGQKEYTALKAEIIYDGNTEARFRYSSIYNAFVNVTDLIKNHPTKEGWYTIANVKATEGIITGGSSAGWNLVFVYESPKETPKSLLVYDGYAQLSMRPIEVTLKDIATPIEGTFTTKMFIAANEGDAKILGDAIEIQEGDTKRYKKISNELRAEDNFFNSTITFENEHIANRNPNSLNTLGYDAALFTIPNENQSIIKNNINKLNVRFRSNEDIVTVTNIAIAIEVEPSTFVRRIQSSNYADLTIPVRNHIITDTIALNSINSITTNETSTLENELSDERATDSEYVKATQRDSVSSELVNDAFKEYKIKSNRPEPIIDQTHRMVNVKNGFYLVANVFSIQSNAEHFKEYLKSKGLQPKSFTNPINDFEYVYLDYYDNINNALEAYYSNYFGKYFKEYWIMKLFTEE